MDNYGLVLFHTSSSAIQAEFVLKRASVCVRLVPTPREYSSDCGIALRFDRDQHETVEAMLQKAHVEISRVVVPAMRQLAHH